IGMSIGAATPMMAVAQSITLYGLVDTGVEYVNNVGATKSGLVRMPNLTGTVPSRWGMRGKEDLGGGVSALFNLQAGFNPSNGR
ncbi:porin, partial [Chromohalobacter sp. HP20-39]|uniref:porin n=1 Tax=Chromohalobacter sp. HP20-39 TaxID=3079306 RepID=UPI00294AE5C0